MENKYTPKLSVVTHYTKNGKEYLTVSQFVNPDESDPYTQKIYMIKSSSKGSWKVYNYKW